MKQPNFTVALIARNERKTLPRLLDSLSEFQSRGGEIILLDTGSTDDTAEYARSRGVKVTEVGKKYLYELGDTAVKEINDKFICTDEEPIVKVGDTLFDFSKARNHIAELATNDVICMPDCDEAFTKFDLDKIIETIESGAEQLEYNFVYSHDANGNEVIKFKHCKFYNRTKMKWVGIIHEVLSGQGNRVFLGEDIIKLEHWQNEETNRSGYLKGLALDVFMNPNNDRNSHYFARELFYHHRYKSAVLEFKRHLTLNGWSTERSESMNYLGRIYFTLGMSDEGMYWLTKAFDLEPRRREPLMYMADMYYQAGAVDHALVYASAAIQIKGEDNFYANYQPFYEDYPHQIIYWALWQKGEFHASKVHFDICFNLKPFEPRYLHDLRYYTELPKMSFIIPTLGRPDGLKRCVDSIKNLNYPLEKIEVIVVHDGEPVAESIYIPENLDIKYFGISERQGVPKTLEFGVSLSTGDWIVYASNDIEFTPDSIIIALKVANDNSKNFMSFNTGDFGPEKGNQAEHFMIHRKMIPKINNEIFDTEFIHAGCDTYLWAQMEKLGQAMRCMRSIVHHYHFSRPGGGEMDEVNKLVWTDEIVARDRDLLNKKLSALKEDQQYEQRQFNG